MFYIRICVIRIYQHTIQNVGSQAPTRFDKSWWHKPGRSTSIGSLIVNLFPLTSWNLRSKTPDWRLSGPSQLYGLYSLTPNCKNAQHKKELGKIATSLQTKLSVSFSRMEMFLNQIFVSKWLIRNKPAWASYQKQKLWVAHAPGMPGTFSPPPTSKETAS